MKIFLLLYCLVTLLFFVILVVKTKLTKTILISELGKPIISTINRRDKADIRLRINSALSICKLVIAGIIPIVNVVFLISICILSIDTLVSKAREGYKKRCENYCINFEKSIQSEIVYTDYDDALDTLNGIVKMN